MNELPKCSDCNQYMFEIGEIGGTIEEVNDKGYVIGVRPQKIYQCPEHKNIAIA